MGFETGLSAVVDASWFLRVSMRDALSTAGVLLLSPVRAAIRGTNMIVTLVISPRTILMVVCVVLVARTLGLL